MILKPSNWDSVIARGDYVYKVYMWVSYGGSDAHFVEFTDDELMSGLTIDNRGYSDLSVGNVSSTMIEFELVDVGSKAYMLTAGAIVHLYLYVKSGYEQSNRAYLGYFTIDNVVTAGSVVKVTAYDSLNYLNDILPVGRQQTISSLRSSIKDYNSRQLLPSSVYNNSRINTLTIPASGMNKEYKVRDVLGTFLAYGAYNAFLHPRGSGTNSLVALHEISNDVSTTESPLGEICTVAALKISEASTFVTGVLLSNGQVSHQCSGGWLLDVDLIEAVDVSQLMADAVFANLSSSIGSLTSTNIEVTGAEVSPLIENGDIVSVDNGDGTYTNFKIAGYRKVINGSCWCDLLAPNNGSNVTEMPISNTSSMTEVGYTTFTPNFEYLGNSIVKFGRYVLSGTAPTWVYNSFAVSVKFGVTYKKADGTQASTSNTACDMVVVNRYEPVNYDSATDKYYVDDVIAHVRGIPSTAVEIVSTTLSLNSSDSQFKLYTQ